MFQKKSIFSIIIFLSTLTPLLHASSAPRTAKTFFTSPAVKKTLGFAGGTGIAVSTIPKAHAEAARFQTNTIQLPADTMPTTRYVSNPGQTSLYLQPIAGKTGVLNKNSIFTIDQNNANSMTNSTSADPTPSPSLSVTRLVLEPTFKQVSPAHQKAESQPAQALEKVGQQRLKQNLDFPNPAEHGEIIEISKPIQSIQEQKKPMQIVQKKEEAVVKNQAKNNQKQVPEVIQESAQEAVTITQPVPAEQNLNPAPKATIQKSFIAKEPEPFALPEQEFTTEFQQTTELQPSQSVEQSVQAKLGQATERVMQNQARTWIQQQPDELSKILMEQDIQQGTDIIQTWQKDYADTTSNMYVQENLKDALVQKFFNTDQTNEIQYVDKKSIKLIEKLREKYKNKHDVYGTLTELLTTLHKQENKQKPNAQQANKIIAHYYTPEMKRDLLLGMGIQPKNPANPSEPLPSIEKITEYAEQNFSTATYKALKAAEKAVDVAIFAYQQESSFLGDSALLAQLKQFKKDIQSTSQKPQFEQYKSFGEQLPQYTANFLDNTGLGNVTLQQAYNGAQIGLGVMQIAGNFVIDGMGARPYATLAEKAATYGVQKATDKIINTTIRDAAQATGLIPSTPALNDTAAITTKKLQDPNLRASLTPAQQKKVDILDQHVPQVQAQTNQALNQYAKPQDLQNVLKVLPRSPNNEQITFPTAQELIEIATHNPSQDTYNALESMLATVKVTLRPELTPADPRSIQGWTKYKQLKEYEHLLTQTLQDQKFTQFKSFPSKVKSYLSSYLPNTESVLTATGIGDMTLGQVQQSYTKPLIQTAQSYAPFVKKMTGIEIDPVQQAQKMTIRQTTDLFGLTPAQT